MARSMLDLLTPAGRRRRTHRLYDRRTFAVIRRVLRADSNCVDVGCHEGVILRRMLDRAPKGRHFAFEPLPHLAARLRAEFPGVEVHEVALSEAPGRSSFVHVTSNPAYSGLRERRYDRPNERTESIDVAVETLDRLLPADLPIALIKIDVEGGELGVLRGAQELIRRWRPHIVFEHGTGAAESYATTPEAVWDLLVENCGLEISLLEKWLWWRAPLTRPDFVEQFTTAANYYFLAHPRR